MRNKFTHLHLNPILKRNTIVPYGCTPHIFTLHLAQTKTTEQSTVLLWSQVFFCWKISRPFPTGTVHLSHFDYKILKVLRSSTHSLLTSCRRAPARTLQPKITTWYKVVIFCVVAMCAHLESLPRLSTCRRSFRAVPQGYFYFHKWKHVEHRLAPTRNDWPKVFFYWKIFQPCLAPSGSDLAFGSHPKLTRSGVRISHESSPRVFFPPLKKQKRLIKAPMF